MVLGLVGFILSEELVEGFEIIDRRGDTQV